VPLSVTTASFTSTSILSCFNTASAFKRVSMRLSSVLSSTFCADLVVLVACARAADGASVSAAMASAAIPVR
jgi:hypothetical protein